MRWQVGTILEAQTSSKKWYVIEDYTPGANVEGDNEPMYRLTVFTQKGRAEEGPYFTSSSVSLDAYDVETWEENGLVAVIPNSEAPSNISAHAEEIENR